MSDVQTKARNGDYNNTLPYGAKANHEKFYVYSKGKVVVNGLVLIDHDDRDAKRSEWKAAGYTVELVLDKDAQRAERDAHYAETRRLDAQFRADLEAEYNMVGHPKADLLFRKAWDQGHAHGYAEVANIYDDLYDLVK